MRTRTLLALALLTAAATSVRAQGLLDQELGTPADATTKPAATKPATPAPDAAKPPVDKADPTITSPDAVKQVDDNDLLKQLLQPDAKPDPDAIKQRLKDMVGRMDDTAKLLTDKKDTGEVTQETQRRIVGDLDVMIELARQQQQSSSKSSSQQQGPPQPGDPQQGPPNKGGSQAATSDPLPHGDFSDPAGTDIHNHDPQSWGLLPSRDRQEVANGANEQYLQAYKEQIDRYYQALAEMARSGHH